MQKAKSSELGGLLSTTPAFKVLQNGMSTHGPFDVQNYSVTLPLSKKGVLPQNRVCYFPDRRE